MMFVLYLEHYYQVYQTACHGRANKIIDEASRDDQVLSRQSHGQLLTSTSTSAATVSHILAHRALVLELNYGCTQTSMMIMELER